jgi:hypothetical protein
LIQPETVTVCPTWLERSEPHMWVRLSMGAGWYRFPPHAEAMKSDEER